MMNCEECRLEGWLSVPNKSRANKFLWKKQYVVVSTKKILFFASENCKQNNDPQLVLDIEWVRSYTLLFVYHVYLDNMVNVMFLLDFMFFF